MTPTCARFAVSWAANFKQWIDTSRNSHSEAKATNNHGTWHDILSLALSLYTSDAAGASRVCSDFLSKRIAVQVQPAGAEVKHGGPDAGALPREDGRTNSQSYHRCRSPPPPLARGLLVENMLASLLRGLGCGQHGCGWPADDGAALLSAAAPAAGRHPWAGQVQQQEREARQAEVGRASAPLYPTCEAPAAQGVLFAASRRAKPTRA